MAETPEVRYVRNGDVRLAWQQWGHGPDVLIVPGMFSNIEISWEHEFSRRSMEFMGHHCKTTIFDKRGMGLSDRTGRPPTLEERASDILAVIDAAGLDNPVVIGVSEGGLIAEMFALRHPDRISRLIVANALPHRSQVAALDPSYFTAVEEWDLDNPIIQSFDRIFEAWGEDAEPLVRQFAPSQLENQGFVRWVARSQRQSCTARDVKQHFRDLARYDLADELPAITVPTKILHCSGDRVIHPIFSKGRADAIRGSELTILDGGDHFFWFGDDWLTPCSKVLEFAVGAPVDQPSERRFATVVFTDIVDSTKATTEHGDAAWRGLLDQHDELAWAGCNRTGGTIVKSTGDGLLARFNLPADALRFATELRDTLRGIGLPIRAGIHAGEIEIRADGDITGIGVNLAARVEQAADNGAIYVSSTVRDMMLGGSVGFENRGEHELKGIDGRWRLYEVMT